MRLATKLLLGAVPLGLLAAAGIAGASGRPPVSNDGGGGSRVDDAPGEDRTDLQALGRMLASETSNRGAQVVIGWITVERAKRARMSVYEFLTRGHGWGPVQVNKRPTGRHASTEANATAATLALARQIVDGEVRPSAAIRSHVPGSWVERKQWRPDADLLSLQEKWSEGIYARIAGSNWVLYSRDTKPISVAPFVDATARLDAVPLLAPVDQGVA